MRISFATALGLSVAFAASCTSPASNDSGADTGAAESSQSGEQLRAPSGDSGTEQDDFDLGSQWDDLSLKQQKNRYLVETSIERARELKARLELEAAEIEVSKALQIDPDNLEAKRLLDEIGTLLGREGAGVSSGAQRLEELYLLKKDQAEADAKQNLSKAKVLRARGDYDAAIIELTLALDIVTLSPYAGEWTDIENEARTMLEEVRAQRDNAAAERRAEAQRKAREALQAQEAADANRRNNVLAHLLSEAIKAFREEDYDEAIELSERVLRLDPRNEQALDIRDTAFRKGRELVRDEYLSKKREQYKRWEEELDELRIPYQGVITLPDIDYWNEITALRAQRPGLDLEQAVEPAEIELRERLAKTILPGLKVEEEESLTTVVRLIQVSTGLPLVVDPLAEDAALTEGVVFDLDLTNALTAEKALNLVTQMAGPEVQWTVRHETILVTTVEKARGELVIINHDVQDLTFPLTDFLGPRIERLRLLEELEDEDGGSPFGAIGEKQRINEADDLATLVQENIAVGTWDDNGTSLTVDDSLGYMVVVHTPAVQRQVKDFLEELRQFSSSLVTIESKFLSVKEGFIQEIGVDWRGLDDTTKDLDDLNFDQNPSLGLDNGGDGITLTPPSAGAFYDDGADGSFAGRTENIFESALGSSLTTIGGLTAQYTFLNDLELSMILRLVEKSENAELINDQMLSVHNTQRAYVTVVNQRAYIQDFDVEVAQFQAIADPVINVLTEGIVLDVRPTIQHSRRYLTLEIQPTVANVANLVDFSTTLAGQTAAVTFQLPELQVQSVYTTAIIPDGGSILLGGLSRVRNIERRAEVPWIANVPLIGFFFKEEGYSDERESLMITIKAWISDVKQELAAMEIR